MKESFKKVQEFNAAMQISENKSFGALPSPAHSELSHKLMAEELKEYREAVDNHDIIEVADALIDMKYVLDGMMLKHGLTWQKAEALFNEVHASNMSKVCTTEKEAADTVIYYRTLGVGSSAYATPSGWVIKRVDGKILKSINYFKPDIERILND